MGGAERTANDYTLKRRATITDVAAACDVSITTVSKVMNRPAETLDVSTDVQARVRAAARRLQYRPSWRARSFAQKRTGVVAVLSYRTVPAVLRGVWGSAGEVLVDAFAQRNRDVQFLSCGTADTGRWQPMLLDGRFEGVVVLDALSTEMASVLEVSGLPAVLLNAPADGRHPTVVPDDREGGRTAARLLVRHGHRHVVFAGDEHRLSLHFSFADRLEGANEVLRAAGCPAATALQLTSEATVSAVLAMRPVPTAVIAYHGMIGVWLLQSFWRRGLRVPHDLSILTFDDLDSCRASIPPLTVLDVPMLDMAGKAAELLLERIEGTAALQDGARKNVVFEEHLVERESVGPAPVRKKG